jgi:ABC-type proline/glycine betaine transport system permease subunit
MDRLVSDDPILERRARIARLAALGKRIGYLALGVAIVGFVAGVITQFASWTVLVSTVGLVVACVVLPVPIVLGYGVRAAAREDRERGGKNPGGHR